MYLLSGTSTPDDASGFPVRLCSVSGGQLVLIRKIASGLFSVTDDLAGHVYVMNLGWTKLTVIHEDDPGREDIVLPPKNSDHDFGYYFLGWGAIAGPGIAPGILYDHATAGEPPVMRIFADAQRGQPRVVPGSWGLFRFLRYAGNGGGPYYYPKPSAEIEGEKIALPYTLGPAQGYLSATPPGLSPNAGLVPGFPDRPRGANVIADTERYFIFSAQSGDLLSQRYTVYILHKRTNLWFTVTMNLSRTTPRLFGDWLTNMVGLPNPDHRASPGEENERAAEVDSAPVPGRVARGPIRLLPKIRGRYERPDDVFNPGVLRLINLADGRRLAITTGQQDSETLAVTQTGEVLYRVNDKIFSAQIQNDKVGPATVVVQGEDVPEVHWLFWSQARPQTGSAHAHSDHAKTTKIRSSLMGGHAAAKAGRFTCVWTILP